jgi:Neprosin
MSNWLHKVPPSAPIDWRVALTLSTALVVTGLVIAAPASAQNTSADEPVPFATFLRGLSNTRASDFMRQAGTAVQDEAAFEEIRDHLLRVYGGQNVRSSFLQDGLTLDCIPLAEQPAKRLRGVTSFAAPPPFSPQVASGRSANPADKGVDLPAEVAKFACPNGTFAMPRMTLEQISRFGSLKAFFAKGPNGAGQAHATADEIIPQNTNGHAYAYAYQGVNNWGGQSTQSLNDPFVDTTRGEVFSLMQNWYIGGTPTQTAEVGWQNFPARNNDQYSRLFAYWTADGYDKTGCYNYDCGAFVQYSGAPISLGQRWTVYSTPGGAQYSITIGFYLYQGNWWLSYGDGWVGYYRGSQYGSGQLSRNATVIEYGTEAYSTGGWWAPEGSGYFAAVGWPYSGYQRTIYYRDSNNGLHYPSLTSVQPSPGCYTDTNQSWGGSVWQYYFFLGGPGGTGC